MFQLFYKYTNIWKNYSSHYREMPYLTRNPAGRNGFYALHKHGIDIFIGTMSFRPVINVSRTLKAFQDDFNRNYIHRTGNR